MDKPPEQQQQQQQQQDEQQPPQQQDEQQQQQTEPVEVASDAPPTEEVVTAPPDGDSAGRSTVPAVSAEGGEAPPPPPPPPVEPPPAEPSPLEPPAADSPDEPSKCASHCPLALLLPYAHTLSFPPCPPLLTLYRGTATSPFSVLPFRNVAHEPPGSEFAFPSCQRDSSHLGRWRAVSRPTPPHTFTATLFLPSLFSRPLFSLTRPRALSPLLLMTTHSRYRRCCCCNRRRCWCC